MFNGQQNIRKEDVFILICNLSIPLCYILSSVSLFATQMLLFAGCHRAVLFRGRTNRKLSPSSSLIHLNTGSSGLSVYLPQGSISPLQTHWIRSGGTHTHSHTLETPTLSSASTLRSRVTTSLGGLSSNGDKMIWRKLNGKKVFLKTFWLTFRRRGLITFWNSCHWKEHKWFRGWWWALNSCFY